MDNSYNFLSNIKNIFTIQPALEPVREIIEEVVPQIEAVVLPEKELTAAERELVAHLYDTIKYREAYYDKYKDNKYTCELCNKTVSHFNKYHHFASLKHKLVSKYANANK
jgi:hypothetical protein